MLTIGNAVSGGGTNQVLFEDGSSNLAASANLTWNGNQLTLGGTSTNPLQVTLNGSVLARIAPLMWANNVNNVPSPLIASASNQANQSSIASNAFDGSTTTQWAATGSTGWIQIDLGSGNATICTSYTVYPCVAGQLSNTVNTWILAGSNDGSTFTTLDSESGGLLGH